MTPACEADSRLEVAIVGAGIGGLAAAVRLRQLGHRVTLLEQARQILPVGAGIQLAPNATSILERLGVLPVLGGRAVAAQISLRRRYEDGRCLGQYPLGEAVIERFGSPYLHAHRGDLHRALASVALDERRPGPPASLLLDTAAVAVEQSGGGPAHVVTAGGARLAADVVVGADGIHSRLRDQIAGPERISFSGDVAYRSLVSRRAVESDPRLAALAEPPSLTIWLGPGRHLVHYLVCGGDYLNVVLCATGTAQVAESWSAVAEVAEVTAMIDGWDDRAIRLVASAESVHRTGLFDREPLDTWTEGRVALLGDACHPMLPYQAQGAAQALEDAEMLGDELAGASSDGVEAALAAYADRRRSRAAAVQRASRSNRQLFHLPDGPEQQERDGALASLSGDFDSYAWIWDDGPRKET